MVGRCWTTAFKRRQRFILFSVCAVVQCLAVSVVVGTAEGTEVGTEVCLVEVGTECKKCSSVLSVVWLVKRVRITPAVRPSGQRDCMMSTFGNADNVQESAPASLCCGCGRVPQGGGPRRSATIVGTPGESTSAFLERTVTVKGYGGSSMQLSKSQARERESRLDGHVRTLYHQTDADAARSIKSSQSFRLGKDGLAGAGIYFAVSKSDTDHKAHKKGVILSADVRLGRVKKISSSGDGSITFESLQSEGYDSVEIPRPGGTEFVVYSPDQVRQVR